MPTSARLASEPDSSPNEGRNFSNKALAMTRGPEPLPAGALRRVPATLVDMVVFCGLSTLLALPLLYSIELPQRTGFDELVALFSEPSWSNHAAGLLGTWVALWWSYFLVGWGWLGATPGKYLLGLRIVDYRQRCPIGIIRALLRLFAYMVSSITLGCGHLLVLVRSDRRALHDILAGTHVVRPGSAGSS